MNSTMNTRSNGGTNRSRVAPIALAAVVALSLSSAFVFSQHGHGHGRHRGHGQVFERILERLDLSAAQEESIHNTMMSYRDQIRQMHEEKIARHRALGQTIHADDFDESAVRGAAAELAEVDEELAVTKARMFQDISKDLTADQRERAKQLIEDWHAMVDESRGRGFGRGHGPGWDE